MIVKIKKLWKGDLISLPILIFLFLSYNSSAQNKIRVEAKELNAISFKAGFSKSGEYDFTEVLFSYKFHHLKNSYLEIGPSIALNLQKEPPANKVFDRISFSSGLQNRLGGFFSYNYSPGYNLTNLSGKLILTFAYHHFSYEENRQFFAQKIYEDHIFSLRTGYGLDFKLIKSLEVSMGSYIEGYYKKPVLSGKEGLGSNFYTHASISYYFIKP